MLKPKDLEFYQLLKEANEIPTSKPVDSNIPDYDEFDEDEIVEEPPIEVSPTYESSSLYDPMN